MSQPRPPILVCYDGSSGAARAVEAAGALFPDHPAIVLYVWPGAATERVRTSAVEGVRDELVEEVRVAARREAADVAEQGAGLARQAGLDAVPLLVETGDRTAEAVVRIATEQSVAAVVVGRPVRRRRGSLLPASVSRSVVERGSVPVVVV